MFFKYQPMGYLTHNEDDLINTSNTHGLGLVDASYSTIFDILGEPIRGRCGDGKVRAEWDIQFSDGLVATIYDWKEYGTPYNNVTEWCIGGRDPQVTERIKTILREGK